MKFALSLFSAAALPLMGQTVPTLHVQVDQVKCQVSPTFYGMMTEEVSHAYEGGLYGELIQNRIFMDDANGPAHWSVVGGNADLMKIDESQPINDALIKPLMIDATKATEGSPIGVANEGYWGVPVKPQATYHVSFYAKANSGYLGPVQVMLQSPDGGTTYAKAEVTGVGDRWKKFETTLATQDTKLAKGRFVLATEAPGTLWIDLVSLFPPTFNDRPNGLRPDLMKLMADMKPSFLRLPGGNYLEGDYLNTRFPWSKSLGPLEERPGHQGCWGYRSSDGMGLLEMLEWCEDLHMQPVLAIYAGYSLKEQHVEPGPLLQPYVQSALDEIEYVTGDAGTTTWGAKRAKDGHPAPFPLKYVEIGNEDWFDKSGSYEGRFSQFADAIKAKYPQLLTIATMGVHHAADVVDEHFYPGEFFSTVKRYDSYPRSGPKVFVGEWATSAPHETPDFHATLSDAAWMTGMERNSDIVVLESYAPLFVNVNPGARQWQPNMIGYDCLTSFGSPSYWLQVMFDGSAGDAVPVSTLDNAPADFYYSVMRDTKNAVLYIKAVNVANVSQTVHLNLAAASSVNVDSTAQATVLSSPDLGAYNAIDNPGKITPQQETVSDASATFDYSFKPQSITVLKLSTR